MDTFNLIGQFISTYGFPIVCCGALFWYIVKEQKETRQVLAELKSIIQSNTEMTRQFVTMVKEVSRDGS